MIYILINNPTALMFLKNQILYMSFQCTDVYGCPKLLDMVRKKEMWTQSGRGSPKEGGSGRGMHVSPPALRAEAFENIDLATQKN